MQLSAAARWEEGVLGDGEKELALDSGNLLCFGGKTQAQEAPGSQALKAESFLQHWSEMLTSCWGLYKGTYNCHKVTYILHGYQGKAF